MINDQSCLHNYIISIIQWLAEVHDSLYRGGGSGGFTTPCRCVKWGVLVPLL